MKKISNLIMVLLLTASMVSLALADEADDTEDEEIIKEIGIMSYQYGSEVRLLQLEKTLTRNILIGEKIIEILQGMDVDTQELETILTEMGWLNEEIQVTDPYSEDSVEQFVDLKNESINLTKEFRDILRGLLDEETLESLREQMKDFFKDELQSLHEQIRSMIKNFNRNQLNFILEVLGLVDEELLEDFTNGEVTLEEVIDHLREYINSLIKEERQDIFSTLKIGNIQRSIYAKATYEDAQEFAQQRKEARWNNRLSRLNDINDPSLRGQMNKRIRGRMGGI